MTRNKSLIGQGHKDIGDLLLDELENDLFPQGPKKKAIRNMLEDSLGEIRLSKSIVIVPSESLFLSFNAHPLFTVLDLNPP
uniref:Uncharacterized protein n=1 Tax=Amphimedon queenslandica TaxID=400682 RepID=A0A1X7UJ74_AMPQE